MTMRCPHCDFGYEVTPSMDIMLILSDPELPNEDYMLWMDRFVRHIGLHEYRGILTHCGIKHVGQANGFTVILNDKERRLLENDRAGANFTGPAHS